MTGGSLAVVCHPERSEGSGSVGAEMLRCAQHDRGGALLSFVILSEAKDLSRGAQRCFAALSMTSGEAAKVDA